MAREMSEKDWELLSRYVDGEMADVERRRLEHRLACESELKARLQAMQRLDSKLAAALGHRDGVPAAVYDMLTVSSTGAGSEASGGLGQPSAGNVIRFPQRSTTPTPVRSTRWPLAAAATVLAALGITLMMSNPSPQGGFPGNDRLVSSALDTVPSGDDWTTLDDGRELRSVLTFAHRDGQWCREFLLRNTDRDVRAVACREDGRWVTQAAGYESYLDSTTAYRPAGAADSAPVSVFISENAAGIALGRQQETNLIASGWR